MAKTYLETDRLIFRDWIASDKPAFAVMNTDPAVMRYFVRPLAGGGSDAFADKIQENIDRTGYGLWAVALKTTKEFIGFIGFNAAVFESDFTPCIEIGWRLKKEAWGNGYATEGAAQCLAYGFRSLHFPVIHSFTSKLNRASERVMVKIGLIKEKDFLHPGIDKGNPLAPHVLCKLSGARFDSHKRWAVHGQGSIHE